MTIPQNSPWHFLKTTPQGSICGVSSSLSLRKDHIPLREYGQDIPSCEHSDSGEGSKDINRSFNGNEIPDTHRCENFCPRTLNQNEEIRPPLNLHHRKVSKARLWHLRPSIPAECSDRTMPKQCVRAGLSLAREGWAEKGERGAPSQVLGALKPVTESQGTSSGSIWILD